MTAPYVMRPEETDQSMPADEDFGPTEYGDDATVDPDLDLEPPDEPPETARSGERTTSPARLVLSPSHIIQSWREAGPIDRIPTGIAPLDTLCGGGLPAIRRVAIVGAPTAGKTYLAARIAKHHSLELKVPVGWLAVDEDPDDILIRFAQMTTGATVGEIERCIPTVLDALIAALRDAPLRFFDAAWTIETAAAALRAEYPEGSATLVVDSIQTVASDASVDAKSLRELVESNVAAVRRVCSGHRLGVYFTSEANRASYRSADAAETSNDLAAGAESRALEYGSQTQLMVRTAPGHNDVTHVRVAKNRRLDRGEFWVRLLRATHDLEQCDDPAASPLAAAQRREIARASEAAKVRGDAEDLARIVRQQPGLGEEALRAAVKIEGLKWGRDRLAAAKRLLETGETGVRLVNRGPHSRQVEWHLEVVSDRREDDDE